ncbi:hypothetical protein [Chitinimonas sp.]|uniref:hypothetical protein n=1 Tax=Chitinimonas sp. TaxID=1934313 RepID=UPI002F9323EB
MQTGQTIFFTSITANYLPKARVLAESVKRHHPDSHFALLLSDTPPEDFALDAEPFDELVSAEALGIAEFPRWAFMHSVVELCTAVKGPAFKYFLARRNTSKVFYLDPDMVVFAPLTPLIDRLDQHSVLLTPHLVEPEEDNRAIVDNEICALKHGVFNLGFLALANTEGGRKFADWWAARLLDYCYDDIPGGLFTDQRWVDLAPCFFDDLEVVRDPAYNIATWNLTHREVGGSLEDGLTVNGQTLRLYHFSGFDSGAQATALTSYAPENRTLWQMREWYIGACERQGQSRLGKRASAYANFGNGEPIRQAHRVLYRSRPDLMKAFPDPYSCEDSNKSYWHWYQAEQTRLGLAPAAGNGASQMEQELAYYRAALANIHGSRSWRLANVIASVARRLRLT